MNETLNTISKRYSCRSFDGILPPRKELEAIAMAALQAPSGMNQQPWMLRVITDKSFIEELDRYTLDHFARQENKSTYQWILDRGGKVYYNAPCMFLLLKRPGTDLDCGIVSENIALAATSLNLGNIICGIMEIPFIGDTGEYFKSCAGFETGWEFGVAVLVGYATQEGEPHIPDTSKFQFIEKV